MSRIFVVTMQRYGNEESHNYVIGAYTCLAKAYIDGIEQGHFHRAGKYEPSIVETRVDCPIGIIKSVSLTVALDYAKLKFPNRFDDRSNLKEEHD